MWSLCEELGISSPNETIASADGKEAVEEAVVATRLQAALAAVKSEASLETINKLVRNCVQNPVGDKFRKIRLTNEKIAAVMAVEGAKTAMLTMGWVEDGEFLVLPAGVRLSMKEVRDIEDAKIKLQLQKEPPGQSTVLSTSTVLATCMEQILGTSELLGKKDKTPVSALASKEVVGLYFSAHWCPPCREFTPELASTYTSILAMGKSFEIVFVSSDHDEPAFLSYFADMPWLALPFADPHALSDKYAIQGIPALVLLDGATGELISKDGRKIVSSDGAGAGFPWKDGLSGGGSREEDGGRAAPSNSEAVHVGPGAAAPALQKQSSLDDLEAQIMLQVMEQSRREQEEIEHAIQLSLQSNAPPMSGQQISDTGREGVQGLWFFEEQGTWKKFDAVGEQEVELAFQRGLETVRSTFFNPRLQKQIVYTYDLNSMQQVNASTGFIRRIKREIQQPIPVPTIPPSPSPAPSISKTEASGEEAVERKPAPSVTPSTYKSLDVELGPPPAYGSLEEKSKEVAEDEQELQAALRMSMETRALEQRVQPAASAAASAEAEARAALLPGGKEEEEEPLPSLLAARSRGVGDDGSEVEAYADRAPPPPPPPLRTQQQPPSYSRMCAPQKKASPLGGPDEARIHEGDGQGTADNADNDPYGWMHTHLARLLPESMQSSEGIWNATISALKVCVRV
jgi:thiol-disulfide isomerase/thioredoxin